MSTRNRIKSLILRPREIRFWLRHPDQILLRMEVRWLIRWFTRFPGVLYLIAYVLFDFILIHRDLVSDSLFEAPLPKNLPGFLLYQFLKLPLWLFFVHRRVGAFFRIDRLEELAVTPCSGKMLWPALCTAPALGISLLFAIDFVVFASTVALGSLVDVDNSQGITHTLVETVEYLFGYLWMAIFFGIWLSVPVFVMTWSSTIYVLSRTVPDLEFLALLRFGFSAWSRLWAGAMLMLVVPLLIVLGIHWITDSLPTWISNFLVLLAFPFHWLLCLAVGMELTERDLNQLIKWKTPEKILRVRQGEELSRVKERLRRTGEI